MSDNKNESECKCGATIFNVFKKTSCQGCRFNEDQERIECDGECEAGESHNQGCLNTFCAVCGGFCIHIPFVDN
jgi:hypothetical protein